MKLIKLAIYDTILWKRKLKLFLVTSIVWILCQTQILSQKQINGK